MIEAVASTHNGMDLLQSALEAVARGFKVFPVHGVAPGGRCTCGKGDCKNVAKHPVQTGWQREATLDRETVIRWFTGQYDGYNYGIATGEASGIVVIDVDPRHGGSESLSGLQPLPLTLTHHTGGGGQHLIFLHPGMHVRNKVGLLPGIDVRADGGLIVGPGSHHCTGGRYSVVDGTQEPVALPKHILDMINHEEKGKSFQLADNIIHGARNDTLFRLACSLRSKGFKEDEILAALQPVDQKRCTPPLGGGELADIARNVMRYEPNYPITEDGIARKFAERKSVEFRSCAGSWWHWTGVRWELDDAAATEAVKELVRDEHEALIGARADEKLIKRALALQSCPKINGVRRLASTDPRFHTKPTSFDCNPWLFGVANGVIDLQSGDLRAASPDYMITKGSDVYFDSKD